MPAPHYSNFLQARCSSWCWTNGVKALKALSLFMAALRSRCGHHIFAVVSFFFCFLAESQQSQTGCLPYFYTWCGPNANLECRSEMCCTRLAGHAGPKKLPKIRHLGTIAQLCRAVSSQLMHISTIVKNLLNSIVSPTCRHNRVNFGPLVAEICWRC